MDKNKYMINFVCTDNFGRSVIAEYCLRNFCEQNNINNLDVISSGIYASSDTSKFSLADYEESKNSK